MPEAKLRRIVVAITGATGAIYGVRLLDMLRAVADIETHLVVSEAGAMTLAAELDMSRADYESKADVLYSVKDIGASIASGSYATHAMIVAPCSMKTLAAMATGMSMNLIGRAADVALKERRPLIALVREAPLNLVHLRNMTTLTEMGGVVFPPVPAFYAGLDNIDAMVDQTVARVLALVGVDSELLRPWQGLARRSDRS